MRNNRLQLCTRVALLLGAATLAAGEDAPAPRDDDALVEPAGSGWRSRLAALWDANGTARSTRPPLAVLHGRAAAGAAPAVCPNRTWAAAVEAAGLMSVKLFGAAGDGVSDDAHAVRAALNATRACGGCVFFPPGVYSLGTGVQIRGCVKGSAGLSATGKVPESTPPNVLLVGPEVGPALSIIDDYSGVLLQDVAVRGSTLGILVRGACTVRFVNVAASFLRDGDHVDTSVGGCNATGCNVVLGSHNAALVVENSFWLWFEGCTFTTVASSGQRPSVILRGAVRGPGKSSGLVEEVYLVRFDRVIFDGGGVQYQQRSNKSATVGFMDFIACTQEASATPLLDVQSDPAVVECAGMQNVVISRYCGSDPLPPRFGSSKSSVVALNCSAPYCRLDGFTIEAAGYPAGIPAVRVYEGMVTGTTIQTGAVDTWAVLGVMDRHGLPAGTWTMNEGAGWRMAGPRIGGGGKPTPALTFALEGAPSPSAVVMVDGSTHYSRPAAPADEPPTIFERSLSTTAAWGAVELGIGDAATLVVPLPGARPGDVLLAAHSGLAPRTHRVQLTAIAGDGEAEAIMANVGAHDAKVPAGRLRVVAMQFG